MRKRSVAYSIIALTMALGLTGCIQVVASPATHTTAAHNAKTKTETEQTPSVSPTPLPPVESSLVQEIKAKFPGYPVVVDVSSIDSRPQNEFNMSGTTKVVALVPGLYMAYNANVTDLDFYIDNAVVSGDCTMMQAYFSQSGGDCWDGVQAGSEEPH
ncbi:hypothetical protein [Humibacter sp. RRB41]|uniref:hypothetical protein n=1 Tax=Humibacter sp. RRB41 TaxID=2919946 RepID=UPI001FA96E98|nr:hypothetical protein [Humibacter sp. RRB41]